MDIRDFAPVGLPYDAWHDWAFAGIANKAYAQYEGGLIEKKERVANVGRIVINGDTMLCGDVACGRGDHSSKMYGRMVETGPFFDIC